MSEPLAGSSSEEHRLSQALGDRYRVERLLGRGGNGVVYLAHDVKHHRPVAVKVLLPELALAVSINRFLREIQIAAKLAHPHILSLHDSGEAQGFLFYVMPYVEGESLRQRLLREKQLSVEEALAITREIADALNYAHSRDVVHRDIKPENILLHAGHAVVADFGIARAITTASGRTVTATGVAIGTPSYMSPEQGSASNQVDGRSDIYSLGCLVYEMLTGHPPFTGTTAQEVLARHVLDPVPSLRAARPNLPEALERAVARALAKAPADRFATAADFAVALTAPAASGMHTLQARKRAYQGLGLTLLLGAVVATAWVLSHTQSSTLRSDPAASGSPTQHRITFDGTVEQAAISPDGQFLAYVTRSDSGWKITVQDLASGSRVPITTSPNTLYSPQWSPDGHRLLVAGWWGTPPALGQRNVEFRVYPRFGGMPVQIPQLQGPFPVWSKDGAQIYASDYHGVHFYALATGVFTRVPLPDSGWLLYSASLHPAGRLLALLERDKTGARMRIRSVEVDSAQRFTPLERGRASAFPSRYISLVEDVGTLSSPRWSPSGLALYYLRANNGTNDLWRLPLNRDGTPLGPPRLLMSGLDALGTIIGQDTIPPEFSITRDGRTLAYAKGQNFSNLWLGRAAGDGWKMVQLTAGTAQDDSPRVSPDGSQVSYLSSAGGSPSVFLASTAGTSSTRQVTHLDSLVGRPAWSPDGRSIAIGLSRGGKPRVAIVSLATAAVTRVFDGTELAPDATMEWAPGSEILYHRGSLDEGRPGFRFLNPRTGVERLLTPESGSGYWDEARYSSDGKNIAFVGSIGLQVISISGGVSRLLVARRVTPLGWSVDGRIVYGVEEPSQALWAIPLGGSEPKLLGTSPRGANSWDTFRGQWFVFSVSESKGDVWRVDGFDPETRE